MSSTQPPLPSPPQAPCLLHLVRRPAHRWRAHRKARTAMGSPPGTTAAAKRERKPCEERPCRASWLWRKPSHLATLRGRRSNPSYPSRDHGLSLTWPELAGRETFSTQLPAQLRVSRVLGRAHGPALLPHICFFKQGSPEKKWLPLRQVTTQAAQCSKNVGLRFTPTQ